MKARRKYTPEEKAEALKLYQEVGPTAAGKRLGIPKNTISKWGKEAGLGTVHSEKTRAATEAAQAKYDALRVELKQKLMKRTHDLNQRMDEPHIESLHRRGETEEITHTVATSACCKDYCTSIGILVDKCNILDGKHTESLELNINGEDPRGKLAHLIAGRRFRRRATEDTSGPD